jgi:hypothetical protein
MGPNAKNSSNDEAKNTAVSPLAPPGESPIDLQVVEKAFVPADPAILDSSHCFDKLWIVSGSSEEVRESTSA